MPGFVLRIIGSFEASVDGRPACGFESAKARALFSFLAVENDRLHSRDQLALLLWPECSEVAAARNLRHALHNLQGVLAGDSNGAKPLRVSRDTIGLDLDAGWADAPTFLALTAGRPTLGALERAVGLVRGPLLDGFSLRDADGFDEWLLTQRERFEQRTLGALQGLAAHAELRGDLAEAERHARAQVAFAPWFEEGHRQLMRALTATGRRSEALAQFARCRRSLEVELEVTPAAATLELGSRIAEGADITLNADERAHLQWLLPGPLPPAPVACIGRDDELAQLRSKLSTARDGRIATVLITGVAGAGKTVLASEFARLAAGRYGDLIVVSASCAGFGGDDEPFLPIRELLLQLCGHTDGGRRSAMLSAEHAHRLRSQLSSAISALLEHAPDLVARLVPLRSTAELVLEQLADGAAWGQRLEECSIAAQVDGSSAGMVRQATDMLGALARSRTMLIIVDDVQWCDRESARVLARLGSGSGDQRLMVVMTRRPGGTATDREADAATPVDELIGALRRDPELLEIDLDRDDPRKFVDAVCDLEPNHLDETFRSELATCGAGNALLTWEIMNHLRSVGVLVRDGDGCWVVGSNFDWSCVPKSVEPLLAEQLAGLSAAERQLLEQAAVEGPVFTAEVVAQCLGRDCGAVLAELDTDLGRRHRLVELHGVEHIALDRDLSTAPRRASHYRFRHALFQSYLYSLPDDARRAHIHESVARSLERIHGDDDEIAVELAGHFEAACLPVEAARALLRAGRRAHAMWAHHDAVRLLRRGVTLLSEVTAATARDQLELDLLTAMAAPLGNVAGPTSPEREDVFTRAAELARTVGNVGQQAALLYFRWNLCQFRADYLAAEAVADDLIDLAGAVGDPRLAVPAAMARGMTRFSRGRFGTARSDLEVCLSLVDGGHHPGPSYVGSDMKIGCLTHLALIDWMEGHPDRAVDLADRALRRGENLDRFNEAIATAAMAEIRLLRREPAVARIHVERLAVLGEANDFPLYRMLAMLLGGWCLVEEGRLAEAVDLLESARVAKQQCQIEMLGTLHLVLQGRAATGHSVGTHLLEQALEEGERSGELLASAEAHREKGRRLAAVGRSDAAESCFARALDVAHGQGALVFELRAATDLAAEWAHKGQRARATELLSPIIASFNEGLDTPDLIEARSILSDLDRRCAAPGSERAVRRS